MSIPDIVQGDVDGDSGVDANEYRQLMGQLADARQVGWVWDEYSFRVCHHYLCVFLEKFLGAGFSI
jgi:hypothetical protein